MILFCSGGVEGRPRGAAAWCRAPAVRGARCDPREPDRPGRHSPPPDGVEARLDTGPTASLRGGDTRNHPIRGRACRPRGSVMVAKPGVWNMDHPPFSLLYRPAGYGYAAFAECVPPAGAGKACVEPNPVDRRSPIPHSASMRAPADGRTPMTITTRGLGRCHSGRADLQSAATGNDATLVGAA